MTNHMIYESKSQKILEYLFVIFTILQCNSIYMFGLFHNKLIIDIIWQCSLFLLLLYSYNTMQRKDIFQLVSFISVYFIFVVLLFIFESIYYPTFHKIYILNLLINPICLIIYFFNSGKHHINLLLYLFNKIIVILSIVSIVFWVMANLHIPPTSEFSTFGWYNSYNIVPIHSYFWLGFFSNIRLKIMGFYLIRNAGIFAEPSMFAYVLNVAILIQLFINKKGKIISKDTVILYLTLITTWSTTNIVFILLAIIYRGLISKNKNNMKYYIIVSMPLLIIFMKYIISSKINTTSKSSLVSSYSVRSDDIRACIDTWKQHLLIGNGLGNISAVTNHIASWRFTVGQTGISSGLPLLLAYGGVFLILLYALPLIFSFFTSKFLVGFSIFTLMPLIYIATQNTYLCLMIISYIWTDCVFGHDKSI